MKTIELSEQELKLLGGLIGQCFCGDNPVLQSIYEALLKAHNGKFFPEPPVSKDDNFRSIYVEAPTIGKVISYNIKAGDQERLCHAEILNVIKKYKGVIIDA